MAGAITKDQARKYWQDERDSATLYEAFAALETDPRLSRLYGKLAASELRHCELWADRLRASGAPPPAYRPSVRTRILAQLARRLGVAFVVPTVAARELAERDRYAAQPDRLVAQLSQDERGHAAVMRMVGTRRYGGPAERATAAVDAATFGNNLRAAVLGATDGLASNFCLLLGIVGGGAAPGDIRLGGVAGLIAGACSMALGEWVSVANAREMARSQVDRELDELHAAPAWAQDQLALVYEAKGLDEAEAQSAARHVLEQGPAAVTELVRSELANDSAPAGASPLGAAAYSFALFSAGACVPLLPYLALASTPAATLASVAASLLALFALGLATSLFNGRPPWYSALRQAAIGAAAAAVTFVVGRLFSASIG